MFSDLHMSNIPWYKEAFPDGYKSLLDKYLAKGFSMDEANIRIEKLSSEDLLLEELRLLYPDIPESILIDRIHSPLRDGFANSNFEGKLKYIKNPPTDYYREQERAWYNRARYRVPAKLEIKKNKLTELLSQDLKFQLRGCNTLLFHRKFEADQIEDFLRSVGVRCFYHFTAKSNLESIFRHNGLYSRLCLENNSIPISFAGGNDDSVMLDTMNNVKQYVHLSYNDDLPMKRRVTGENINELVVLKISTEVALFSPTLFTDSNAASYSCKIDKNLDFLKSLNLSAAMRKHVYRGDDDFRVNQAEVLVKTWVPLKYILNIMDFVEYLPKDL